MLHEGVSNVSCVAAISHPLFHTMCILCVIIKNYGRTRRNLNFRLTHAADLRGGARELPSSRVDDSTALGKCNITRRAMG